MKGKKILVGLLVLVIPVAVMILLTPALPANIPIHRGINGSSTYIPKKYAFLLGFLPFIVYLSYQYKRNRY